jgi:hypothetical protein
MRLSTVALNYFSVGEIEDFENQLIEDMSQDEYLSGLLRGGTTADSVVQAVRNFFGINIIARSAAATESMFPNVFGTEALDKISDRDRLAAGLQILGIELKYNPVIDAFNNGGAVYQVGYVRNGSFQPFVLNGETVTFEREQDEASSFATFAARQTFIAAFNGGATREELERLDFEYLRTLPHMTDEMLRERFPNLMEEISDTSGGGGNSP